MAAAQVLRLSGRFLRHRFSDLHPFEVQASLQNACNLRCSYCRCPEVETDVMSTAEWLDIIGHLAAVGTMRIKFQGGEPTLRRDFRELSAAVRSHGIIAAVVTNGTVIARRPDLLDELDEVVVSLDSATPPIHDAQRGAGSHDLAVRALDAARARGVRPFINMVVTTQNVGEIDPMLDFCAARGIGLNAQPAMFVRNYQNVASSHLGLSVEAERAMNRSLAQWRRQGRPVMFSAQSYEHAAEWPDPSSPTRLGESASTCMAGRFYIHIDPNGDVLPCILQKSSFTPANIRRDGFDAAVRHARSHTCADCSMAYLNERKALFALRPHAVLNWLRGTRS